MSLVVESQKICKPKSSTDSHHYPTKPPNHLSIFITHLQALLCIYIYVYVHLIYIYTVYTPKSQNAQFFFQKLSPFMDLS